MRPKSAIYGASVFAIAIAVAGAYFAFQGDSIRNDRLTVESVATIESVDVRRGVDPIFGNEYTVDVSVTYRYEVDGHEYRGMTRLSRAEAESFVPWRTAKVCFEPGNFTTVEHPKLFPPNYNCGDD
jgi:hypothetical protein